MSPRASSLRFLQAQPDARLVELAHAGHERAFEAVVRRYRHELLAYCRRLTAAEASAEDVLQQALLQAWVAIGRDGEIYDVRAWLYQIVHNVAVTNFRRATADSVELHATASSDGADSEAERRLAVRDALAGLAALPELQRQVMLGTALEGRSHEEIAAALGLSHGAVRGLIYRARAALRATAAALIPGPVLTWAVRHEVHGGGGSSHFLEAVAGGGSAGVGGFVVKGTAIVATAGALASAAGLNPIHGGRSAPRKTPSHTLRAANESAGVAPSAGVVRSSAAPGVTALVTARPDVGHVRAIFVSELRSSPTSSGFHRAAQPSFSPRPASPVPSSHRSDGANDGRLNVGSSGSDGSTGGGSRTSGRPDASPGHDGGLGGGTSSGSGSTGGGHDGGSSGLSDGGSTPGQDGGSSGGIDGGATGGTASRGSDGGTSSGQDGGSAVATSTSPSDTGISGGTTSSDGATSDATGGSGSGDG